MSYYKVRTKKQLQQLSNKHKELKDQIRAENEAELTSTEDRLYDVGKIFRPLVEQSLTTPFKKDCQRCCAGCSTSAGRASSDRSSPYKSCTDDVYTTTSSAVSSTTSLLQLTPHAERTVQINIDKELI